MRSVMSVLAVALLAGCASVATPLPTDTPGPPTAEPTPRVTPEPTDPPDTSSPADTPSRDEAYQQLIVSIPVELAAKCKPAPKSEKFEPGQLAQADCDLPNGALADFVTYRLFDGFDSLNAFFDKERSSHEKSGNATGPGCGVGPGEGTWDSGRKDCFISGGNQAHVMWTHELLYIDADAFRVDRDFGKLETFWANAGPVTP